MIGILNLKRFEIPSKNIYEKDIQDLGGKLESDVSLLKILSDVYPNFEWLPWKFSSCPQNYWSDLSNQRKFLDHISKQLHHKDFSDWYKLTNRVSLPTFKNIYKQGHPKNWRETRSLRQIQ